MNIRPKKTLALIIFLLIAQGLASANSYVFKSEDPDSNWKIVLHLNDSLYFIGERYLGTVSRKPGYPGRTVAISKTDLKGDVIWESILKNPRDLHFLSASKFENGDLCVLTAVAHYNNQSKEELFYSSLYFLNKSGKVVWNKVLEDPYVSKDILRDLYFKRHHVLAVPEFGCILVRDRYFTSGTAEAVAFNIEGKLLYKNGFGNKLPVLIADFIHGNGHGWLFGVYEIDNKDRYEADIELMKFDLKSGKVSSSFKIGLFEYAGIYKAEYIPEKGFILVGKMKSSPWILMIDKNGKVLWQKNLSEMRLASYHNVKLASDGSTFVFGTSDDMLDELSLSGSFAHKFNTDGDFSNLFHSKMNGFRVLDFFEMDQQVYFLGETPSVETGLVSKIRSSCELEKAYCKSKQ